MNKKIFRNLLFSFLCLFLFIQCSNDPASSTNESEDNPKKMEGKILSLNTQILNWNELKLGLINLANLEFMGEIKYSAGENLCCVDIVSDSSFSFVLPANIDERWLALTGNSPTFFTIAFNDTNNNGLFDFDPDPEPYEILRIEGNITGNAFYVTNPEVYGMLNIEVSIGWNYLNSASTASSDFDKLFLLRSY